MRGKSEGTIEGSEAVPGDNIGKRERKRKEGGKKERIE